MNWEVTITAPDGTLATHRVERQEPPNGGPPVWRVDGAEVACDVRESGAGVLSLLEAGRSHEARRDGEWLLLDGVRYAAEVRDPRSLRARRRDDASGDGPRKITAPMPGKVVRILVEEGAAVEAGQGVLVIEAMKMQNELKSPKKGVVGKISAAVGATVNPGEVLAVVE